MLIACVDSVHKDSLSNRLNDQRKDGSFCDVLLKVSGQVLPTHACVLSACSPYFRGLICGERSLTPHLTAGTPQEIELDVSGVAGPLGPEQEAGGLEAIVGLIDYIYTGKINLKQNGVALVLRLAEAFMLEGLLALIKNYVKDSPTNAKQIVTSVAQAESAVPKFVRARQVVTLPIRRQRKLPPRKLCVLAEPITITDADQIPKLRPLNCRKRGRPPVAGTSSSSHVAVPLSEEESGTKRKVRSIVKKKRYRILRQALKKVGNVQKLIKPSWTYSCLSCDYSTTQCGRMVQHLQTADHAETKCCICEHDAENREAFLSHLLQHDPQKPFFCKQCPFKCGSRSQLTAHEMKHSTARPFACQECGRAFKWKKGLQTHMLSHTKEKPLMCDQCDFRTAYSSVLSMHLRIHTGDMLTCPHDGCNFKAYSKRHIIKHGLTHSKEKPYVCEVCGQKYAQIESLKRHSKVHNPDTKILHCEKCQYSTTRRDKMTEHSKKSHCSTDRSLKSTSDRSKKPNTRPARAASGRPTKRPHDNVDPRAENNHAGKKLIGYDHAPRLESYLGDKEMQYFGGPLALKGEHYHQGKKSHQFLDQASRSEHYHPTKDSHHFDQQHRAEQYSRECGWDGGDPGSQHFLVAHQRESAAAAAAAAMTFVTTHLGLMDMVHP